MEFLGGCWNGGEKVYYVSIQVLELDQEMDINRIALIFPELSFQTKKANHPQSTSSTPSSLHPALWVSIKKHARCAPSDTANARDAATPFPERRDRRACVGTWEVRDVRRRSDGIKSVGGRGVVRNADRKLMVSGGWIWLCWGGCCGWVVFDMVWCWGKRMRWMDGVLWSVTWILFGSLVLCGNRWFEWMKRGTVWFSFSSTCDFLVRVLWCDLDK